VPTPTTIHTHPQYTLHHCNTRLHHPAHPFLVSLTSTLDTPRSWRATEKQQQHSFSRRPQTQPARAHHDYSHGPRQASIPLIPCLSRPKGHRPGRHEHCYTRGHPRYPPRPWLYRPLRVAVSRSMPVSLPIHHMLPVLYYCRLTLFQTLSTDTCYFQTSMPAQIHPRLLADPPTTPLLERRHPARPYPL